MKTDQKNKTDTAAFENALARTGEGRYSLSLYVTGTSRRSIRTVETIKALCEQHLKGRYDLEVVDLYQQPQKAKDAQIIAAPTLIKKLPPPFRRLIGDLTDSDRVLIALNLKSDND